MFSSTSRYAKLDVATLAVRDSDGETRSIRYVQRRFLPSATEAGTPMVEHTVVQGDRLDNITAKYLADPTQFWRLCDANDVMEPDELTDEPGRGIVIILPDVKEIS